MEDACLADGLMAAAPVSLEDLRGNGSTGSGLVLGAGDEVLDMLDLVSEGSGRMRRVCSLGGRGERGVAMCSAGRPRGRIRGLFVHSTLNEGVKVRLDTCSIEGPIVCRRRLNAALCICPSQW